MVAATLRVLGDRLAHQPKQRPWLICGSAPDPGSQPGLMQALSEDLLAEASAVLQQDIGRLLGYVGIAAPLLGIAIALEQTRRKQVLERIVTGPAMSPPQVAALSLLDVVTTATGAHGFVSLTPWQARA